MLLWPWTVAGFGPRLLLPQSTILSLASYRPFVLYGFIAYHPINTVFSTNLPNNTVNLNENFTLLCNADANPAASYRLYREQESLEEQNNGTYLTFVSTRTKQVAYRCIPFNSYGDGPSKVITVTVYCKYIYIDYSSKILHSLTCVLCYFRYVGGKNSRCLNTFFTPPSWQQ